jgi:FdhD protein
MGSARIGGRQGPGRGNVDHDGERWRVRLTDTGTRAAQALQSARDVGWPRLSQLRMATSPTSDLDDALPAPVVQCEVQRQRRGADGTWQSRDEHDVIASEVPVALVFNGISHAVMMATPCDLEAFAVGFALSEGIVATRAECYGLEVIANASGCEVQIEVAASVAAKLKEQRRSLIGRTGCGVCGIDSLERLDLNPELLRPAAWTQQLTPAIVLHAFAQLPSMQPLNTQTGAHHAAGWANAEGTLLQVMEDVGRHNALDKLLGARAMKGESFADVFNEGFVVMSSRASYELVRKCARLGVPVLAAISAPTSLAIDIAQQAGMQLYGFCRGEQAVRYAAGTAATLRTRSS